MENILFWKIQVARCEEALEDENLTELFVDRATHSQYEGDLQNYWEETANKNPLFGKLISLSLAFVKDNTIRVKYFTGKEKDLLKTFINTVKSPYFNDYKLACFDSQFLLPFLGIRLDINGIKESLPEDLRYRGRKPWDLTGIDIRDYYQGGGAYRPTLRELCYIYNIDRGFLDWREEDKVYYAKKYEVLEGSAINEMVSLINVFRSIHNLEHITDLECSTTKVEEVKIEPPKTLLHELYESKSFSADFQRRLQKQLQKRKIKVRDIPKVKDLVKAVYRERIDTIDKDRKEKEFINKERDQEIDEFFENLK